MTKLFYMPLNTGDWLKDPNLRMCSLRAKGLWIQLISLMWESKERGKISGTYDQIAQSVGCSTKEFKTALKEIIDTKTADIKMSDGVLTIISRRLAREEKNRKNKNLRSKKHYNRHHSDDIKTNLRHDSELKTIYNYNYINSFSSEVLSLVDLFIEKRNQIKEISLSESDYKKWCDSVRLQIEVDKDNPSEISEVIKWVTSEPFWQSNCLSIKKFRIKKDGVRYFDTFKIKMDADMNIKSSKNFSKVGDYDHM